LLPSSARAADRYLPRAKPRWSGQRKRTRS
jgi:hypothetical protein